VTSKEAKIVVIGGGTGTYTVLRGLKKYTSNLTAIVTMMDSGGSSGRLRDEFGILPPGDVRQALIALSNESSLLRALFDYRYSKGEGLEGHSLGNLFLTALAETTGGMDKAVEEAGTILNIKGRVLPITNDNSTLVATYENGLVVEGEGKIDEPEHNGELRIKTISLKPAARAYPKSLEAIEQADLIIMGPGDLYTSLIPNLLVEGVAEAVEKSKAKKLYIINLMTKFGQTHGFKASNFVTEIEKYAGKCLDYVLINDKTLPEEIIKRYYEKDKETPVVDDLNGDSYKLVRNDFLAEGPIKRKSGDLLKRSLIRHDSDKLAKAIMEIVEEICAESLGM